MRKLNIWDRLKAVSEKVGIKQGSLITMKHRGYVPAQHDTNIVLASRNTEYEITAEELLALRNNPAPTGK